MRGNRGHRHPRSGTLRSFAIDSSFLVFFILLEGAVWSVHRAGGNCGQRPHRAQTSDTVRWIPVWKEGCDEGTIVRQNPLSQIIGGPGPRSEPNSKGTPRGWEPCPSGRRPANSPPLLSARSLVPPTRPRSTACRTGSMGARSMMPPSPNTGPSPARPGAGRVLTRTAAASPSACAAPLTGAKRSGSLPGPTSARDSLCQGEGRRRELVQNRGHAEAQRVVQRRAEAVRMAIDQPRDQCVTASVQAGQLLRQVESRAETT